MKQLRKQIKQKESIFLDKYNDILLDDDIVIIKIKDFTTSVGIVNEALQHIDILPKSETSSISLKLEDYCSNFDVDILKLYETKEENDSMLSTIIKQK